MTCEGIWELTCYAPGIVSGQRINPGYSLIYHMNEEDDHFNDRYYLKDNEINDSKVSKQDFESIDWPSWLNPKEKIKIRIFASGNYVIEDE